MTGEIVRGVYPQVKKLRENGYTLKMLVRVFKENGVVITANALSTYLKNLALPKEQAPAKAASKGTVGSPTVDVRPRQFQMKPDVTLYVRRDVNGKGFLCNGQCWAGWPSATSAYHEGIDWLFRQCSRHIFEKVCGDDCGTAMWPQP
jgi:hypothetical protein